MCVRDYIKSRAIGGERERERQRRFLRTARWRDAQSRDDEQEREERHENDVGGLRGWRKERVRVAYCGMVE